jgi:hypothetical protein
MKKEGVFIVAILFVLFAAFALYSTFSYKTCYVYGCFQERMTKCAFATFINEEPEASWQYDIEGKSQGKCAIQVTLLQAKEGDLSLKGFEKHTMLCLYELGTAAYPEKDMAKCHGLLKEDLQGVLITKLHEYVINNLGSINGVLNKTS